METGAGQGIRYPIATRIFAPWYQKGHLWLLECNPATPVAETPTPLEPDLAVLNAPATSQQTMDELDAQAMLWGNLYRGAGIVLALLGLSIALSQILFGSATGWWLPGLQLVLMVLTGVIVTWAISRKIRGQFIAARNAAEARRFGNDLLWTGSGEPDETHLERARHRQFPGARAGESAVHIGGADTVEPRPDDEGRPVGHHQLALGYIKYN